MPRPGQPPPSTLRNRNRITNKTRLKIYLGNVDVDHIIPDEDEEKNRLLQSVAGVDQEDAKEHHLQQVLSEAALAGQKNEQAAFIPIPEHSGLSEDYASLYPTDRWKDPVSYVQSSSVIDEFVSAALADGCTYYMDERDKEWLDRNNEEARGEGTSAQGSISSTTGRTSARSAKAKGKEPEDAHAIVMSEDEFELVMGLFEKITQEKTEFLHHSLQSGQNHFPELSEYQEVLSAPLPPSTFASYASPSWLPEPLHLVRLARIVYPYWKERCLERAGRRIIPALNLDESDTLNESYVCFRRRETKAVRKTRASQVTSSDKLTRLQSELEFPLELAKQLLTREQVKRDAARQSQVVWDLRMKMVELKAKNPMLSDKGDDELLVDKERPSRKNDSRVRLPVKSEAAAQPSTPSRDILRPKERHALYQAHVEKQLQHRKEQDQPWDDHVDAGYVSTMTPYASKLFKYISPPPSLKRSSEDSESTSNQESMPKRPIRLRYGRGGRTYVDRRLSTSHYNTKRRRRISTKVDENEEARMDVDEDDVVLKEDEDADHRLAERWRFDGDDGPPHGPSGSDEQDRVLVDDYDSKYMNFLFDANDYGFLATDHTILRIATDGKKESYTPYRLGATPAMSISVNARPSIQGQGAIPVSQQVHQSVPISQQLKLPSGPSAVRPSVSGTPGAQGSPVPSAATTSSQSSPPRPSTVIPSPQVTHNGRPAMNMPSMDAIKLASNANVPVASFQQNSEQPDAGNTGFSQAEVARPKSQQQVHASPPQQIQPQTQGPAQAAASVNGLHPAYAALANANPTAYTLPQYIYPTNNSGLNNQQLQNLKSALSAANASSAQNYNAALFAQMQMPKTTNGVVVNGVTSATANPNMQNLGTSINLKPPPVRQMQRVPSGNNVNGAPSSSPPRPPSTVNGVPHNTANSPSPHMMHAMIAGDHVPVRAPSARLSASPMAAHAQMHQQPQMHNGHQVLQMFPQSSPPPMFASSQSYSLSPSPSKMQPASVPNGSPVMQPQQQQQQQVVGTSQGVY